MMTKNESTTPRGVEEARTKLTQLRGRKYWRSLEEWAETEEFKQAIHRHFPSRFEEVLDPVTRRTFLKVMGASLAFAGMAGCSPVQPREKILPYANPLPEQLVPGNPLFFATSMPWEGYAMGLLVESQMGRPVKIEGNPAHPASLGAASAFAQASVLSLYDPDRSSTVTQNGKISSWDNFLQAMLEHRARHRENGGAGLRFLTGTVTSPTLAAQMAQLLSPAHFPAARWHQWQPATGSSGRAALGNFDAVYNLENADVVVALDSNFLLDGPASLAYARQYSRRKRVRDGQTQILRHYQVESSPTLTGANADHRLRLRPSHVELAARALAGGVGVAAAQGQLPAEAARWVAAVVRDLQAHRGRSVVIPGEYASPAVHQIAFAMNQALGNVGATVVYQTPVDAQPVDQVASLRELMADVAAGSVDTLVMLGVNPVYTAPADLEFERNVVDRVPLRIHLGEYADETAFISHWHVPQAHYLETWGDLRAYDGTISIQQPLIAPLFGGKSPLEVLAGLLGQGNRAAYEIVREYWQAQIPGAAPAAAAGQQVVVGGVDASRVPNAAFEDFWTASLNNGVVQMPGAAGQQQAAPAAQQQATAAAAGTAAAGAAQAAPAGTQQAQPAAAAPAAQGASPAGAPPAGAQAQQPATPPPAAAPQPGAPRPGGLPQVDLAALQQAPPAVTSQYEINFRPDPTVWDGTFSNNGWMQELPKPLTKLTWENAAVMSVRTAQALEVKDGDEVRLTLNGRSVAAPVRILPGHPDGLVTAYLGYGRRRAGRVGDKIGYDAYALRTTDALWTAGGLEVAATGESHALAVTDQHNIIYAGQWQPDPDARRAMSGSPERDYRLHNEFPGDTAGYVEGEQGRDIVKSATIAEFLANPDIFQRVEGHGEPSGALPVQQPGGSTETHDADENPGPDAGLPHQAAAAAEEPHEIKMPGEEHPTLLPEWAYRNNKWGMAIDTQACIGCNACVVACQSENNIPVVGKEQVLMHREMHWLRIDTYFEGPVDDPNTYFAPIPCMHCETAPCEIVCPVGATIHSEEGTNDMVYNRCVGTRYCSNNCPYKVRRFNFLYYADQTPLALLRANPDVTIRTRGVMEKCTYCIQRIWHTRIEAEKANRPIRDGEIMTACQQTCPTEAIIFGNYNDPNAALTKLRQTKLSYGMLEVLNTRPRTIYLAHLDNPNPELSEA